ncbi:unnamed protein product, partial [Durusdinium trenchii]
MAVTPFRAKAEERAKLKANESESPEPPSKRVCNTYEKQLAKLPKGDLQTVKDMGSGTDLLDYVSSFRGESSGAHPASLISELYGASEHSNMLHCQQIEGWYAEYANTVRNMPYLYKKPSQVDAKDVDTILYFDCPKLGVLSQAEINMVGDMSEKVLGKNPTRSVLVLIPPKLEDKLLASRIEMRAFTLNLDLSEIHGNRDLPSAFICYLGVCDATLPLKGTAHRSIRGDRKSFYAAVVVNPTTYDGCLELAGVKGGYTVLASSGYHPAYTCSKELVKTHLQFLQDFDRDWGVAIPSSSPQKPASTPTPEKTLAKQEVKETSEEFWAKHFKEDPKTVDALKSKFGDDITEMAGADQASSLILTPGPQLYIAAKDATCLQLSATVPLISHGAGTWLLGAKADKFKSENPNKGIPCSWSSDEVPVIVEEIAFACLKVERFPNQLST